MTKVRNVTTDRTVAFGDIRTGNCFEHEGCLFVKLPQTTPVGNASIMKNAAKVGDNSGCLSTFSGGVRVVSVREVLYDVETTIDDKSHAR